MITLKQVSILFSLLLLTTALCPLIIETTSIVTIKDHINPDDNKELIIFDLDNTCFESAHKHSIGGDQWFTALMTQGKAAGLPEHEAFAKTLIFWSELQTIIPVKPVEEHVVTLINSLQQQQKSIIALTTRSTHAIDNTIKHLASIGITFFKSHPAVEKLNFDHLPIKATYREGILFCGDNQKGRVLKTLLDAMPDKPTKIIFIDDKKKYLECVEKTAQELNIPFVGLRYGHLDQKVKTFSLHHAATDPDADHITMMVRKFVDDHHKPLIKQNILLIPQHD